MASEGQTRITLQAATLTDVGVVRDHNEDSAHIDPEHCFFIVADGMGGHAAGEVASAMAVDKVRESLEQARPEILRFARTHDDERRKAMIAILEEAVRTAHETVFETGIRDSDKHGMGTTLDVVLVAGSEAFIAHVGDSRTYLVRDGRASQLTTDHTVAEVLVIEGKLSLEEAQISPLRTILVNAIGVAEEVGIEMAHLQLVEGDQLLLCSDGLHDYFPVEQELADHLTQSSPEQALSDLIEIAKERGGHDNITGVVVRVVRSETSSAQDGDAAGANGIGVPGTIERDDTLPVPGQDDEDAEANEDADEDEEAAADAGEDEDTGEAAGAADSDAKPTKRRLGKLRGLFSRDSEPKPSDERGEEFSSNLIEEPTLEHERPLELRPAPKPDKTKA